jgi:hypothetical protein
MLITKHPFKTRLRIALTTTTSILYVVVLLLIGWQVAPIATQPLLNMPQAAVVNAATIPRTASSPLVMANTTSNEPMCRFGFSMAQGAITAYNQAQVASLRAGWYSSFSVQATPPLPNGMEFVQTVRVHQKKTGPEYNAPYVVPYSYTVQPNLATIAAIAFATPGQLWLIGNEIDRVDFYCYWAPACGQDEIVPGTYAQAYHEIYQVIKAADPTAQVAIGGVTLVSPLRLKYLDLIWSAYRNRYGTTMPIDVWNVHPYIIPEVKDGFGADVPAGLTETQGIVYALRDNDNVSIFQQQITTFRQWMAAKGQQNKPLVISEFGVNMPTWVFDGQEYFTLARVRNYMYGAFNFLLTAKDPALGYPADDYRLVQRWNWYSLDENPENYGGSLFSYTVGTIDQLGLDWVAYVNDATRPLTPALNLKMLPVNYEVALPDESGKMTATLYLHVSNSGYRNITNTIPIQLTDANGSPISQTSVIGLQGCGSSKTAVLQIPNLSPGIYLWKVEVDPAQTLLDENLTDNKLAFTLLAPTYRNYLPLVTR